MLIADVPFSANLMIARNSLERVRTTVVQIPQDLVPETRFHVKFRLITFRVAAVMDVAQTESMELDRLSSQLIEEAPPSFAGSADRRVEVALM